MSLNPEEVARTRIELGEHLAASGLDVEAISSTLGIDRARVDAVLTMTSAANPSDVWAVRDLLEAAIEAGGGAPAPFTTMPESMRRTADGWFGLRPRAEIRAALRDQAQAPA